MDEYYDEQQQSSVIEDLVRDGVVERDMATGEVSLSRDHSSSVNRYETQ